jgi:hypothetical protein
MIGTPYLDKPHPERRRPDRRAARPSDLASRAADASSFILAHATATRALEEWCDIIGLSQGPIWARLLATVEAVTPPDDVAADLELTPNETVLLRKVELMRGPVPLARADNWFVPSRLPDTMASELITTEVPFGRLIRPLGGYRIETKVDLPPLTDADLWTERGRPLVPRTAFEHHAIVCRGALDPSGGRPALADNAKLGNVRLAVVHERFLTTLIGSGLRSPVDQRPVAP